MMEQIQQPPLQYLFTETGPVTCVKIKVPVVIAEEEIQVLVDTDATMPELAKKIDHIDAKVRDLEAETVFVHERGDYISDPIFNMYANFCHPPMDRDVVVKKLVISGTLHKQVYYVNKEDDVRHFEENLVFSKMVELRRPQPVLNRDEVFAQFPRARVSVDFDLPRPSRLHQLAVIIVKVKVVEERQIFVQVCPSPEECPAGNLLQDPSIEQWASKTVPVFWGVTGNIQRTNIAHDGGYAAEFGVPSPDDMAALYQFVRRGIIDRRQYQLTFWARENTIPGGVSNFSLAAEIVFYNRAGVQIGAAAQNFSGLSISDDVYTQFQVTSGRTPRDTASALVRFTFIPAANNTNTLKIDQVTLECIREVPF